MGNEQAKISSYGYRVIKVAPGSPAQQAGLIEFLDYIIDISSSGDQTPLSGNYSDFFKTVQKSEDQETTMKVYNILYRKTRIVTIVPSKKWENADSLLGALVRYEEYATAHERVLRISKVYDNSPASISGLQPETDFLLGSPQYLYTDLNELANFIEMTQEKETIKSLEIYLYNTQTNSVRSTLIIPNKNWGGAGFLGCEFGLGILNYLPLLEDNMFVSNLETYPGSSGVGSADRLDDDDSKEDIQQSSDNRETVNGVDKSGEVPEFKLRPPTDSEIDHHKHDHKGESPSPSNYNLSHEAANQRMKLLHLSHQHKSNVKSASKPFIKSGRSAANPFHDPKGNENQGDTSLASFSTAEQETKDVSHHTENINGEQLHNISPIGSEKVIEENSQEKDSLREIVNEVPLAEKKEELNKSSGKVPNEGSRSDINKNSVASAEKRDVRKPSLEFKENGLGKSGEIQEKQACKTTFEYNFFSKKLNGDYKIKSTNLFSVEELTQIN